MPQIKIKMDENGLFIELDGREGELIALLMTAIKFNTQMNGIFRFTSANFDDLNKMADEELPDVMPIINSIKNNQNPNLN